MKVTELRDDQLRHAIQCDACKMTDKNDVQLCGAGMAMGDSKRILREEIARRDRERHGATS